MGGGGRKEGRGFEQDGSRRLGTRIGEESEARGWNGRPMIKRTGAPSEGAMALPGAHALPLGHMPHATCVPRPGRPGLHHNVSTYTVVCASHARSIACQDVDPQFPIRSHAVASPALRCFMTQVFSYFQSRNLPHSHRP